MSNLTPFEIRLELLKMAKDLLLEEYHSGKDRLINEWQVKVESAKLNGQTPEGDFEPVLEAHYRGDFTSLKFKNAESFSRPIITIPTTTTKFNWE